jgi:hypothetical protein
MIRGKIQEREECGHKPAAHRLQNEVGLELIKVGLVKAIPEVLTELGLDAHLLLTTAGICPETFNDPENVIPLRALGRLLSESAKRSRCEHVGLLIGQRASTPALGLVGLLLEHSTCVHDALQNLARYVHLQDGCGITILTVANHTAWLGYRILEIALPGAFEFVDAVMASRFNIMRRLCGRP